MSSPRTRSPGAGDPSAPREGRSSGDTAGPGQRSGWPLAPVTEPSARDCCGPPSLDEQGPRRCPLSLLKCASRCPAWPHAGLLRHQGPPHCSAPGGAAQGPDGEARMLGDSDRQQAARGEVPGWRWPEAGARPLGSQPGDVVPERRRKDWTPPRGGRGQDLSGRTCLRRAGPQGPGTSGTSRGCPAGGWIVPPRPGQAGAGAGAFGNRWAATRLVGQK